MEIRGKSISYSTFRKKKMLEKEKNSRTGNIPFGAKLVRTGINRLGKQAK